MQESRPTLRRRAQEWIGSELTLAHLPLPMLGLAASYGVFQFSLLFVPFVFALFSAAAFELTYIGVSRLRIEDDKGRRRATYISAGAVAVSVIYNTLAGLFHRNPAWLIDMHWGWEWALAILHGAPLAVVAYFVADLLIHQQAHEQRTEKSAVADRSLFEEVLAQGKALAEELATLRQQEAEARASLGQAVGNLQQELGGLRESNAALTQELVTLRQEQAGGAEVGGKTVALLDKTSGQLDALRQELVTTREELGALRSESGTLVEELASLRQEQAKSEETLAQELTTLRGELATLPQAPIYSCDHCGQEFTSKQALGPHQRGCVKRLAAMTNGNGHH